MGEILGEIFGTIFIKGFLDSSFKVGTYILSLLTIIGAEENQEQMPLWKNALSYLFGIVVTLALIIGFFWLLFSIF